MISYMKMNETERGNREFLLTCMGQAGSSEPWLPGAKLRHLFSLAAEMPPFRVFPDMLYGKDAIDPEEVIRLARKAESRMNKIRARDNQHLAPVR